MVGVQVPLGDNILGDANAKVTLIEYVDRIVPVEDEDVSRALEKLFRSDKPVGLLK